MTFARKIEKTTIFFIKLMLFICLFILFFGWFSIDNPQIIQQSRTAAITMTTFVFLGIGMTGVYGGFAVGKKKKREIIPSLCIAAFITDFVTYFQLTIMNVNQYNQDSFNFRNNSIFIIVFVLQIIAIYLFVYLGDYVYFKINPPENCVVICDDIENSEAILSKIAKNENQYKVLDVISYQDENLKENIRRSDSVFIYNVPNLQRDQVIEYAYKHFTNIYLTTGLSDVIINYAKPFFLDDLPMVSSKMLGLTFEQRILKRTLDIVVSFFALVIFSPIMFIVAFLIRLDDHGKIFFKQKRATLNGRTFEVFKFRTMHENAEELMGSHSATKDDNRITRVGKVLRKLRLDELPQLINILKGEMSLVGPRPEMVEQAQKYTEQLPEFCYRLRVKSGLTGLAQVVGKYNTSPKDKLMLDLMYIEKYSIWQDILLLFRTIGVFFKSDSTEGFENKPE